MFAPNIATLHAKNLIFGLVLRADLSKRPNIVALHARNLLFVWTLMALHAKRKPSNLLAWHDGNLNFSLQRDTLKLEL